jgi:DNA-binding transcriptional ArsR family regulator
VEHTHIMSDAIWPALADPTRRALLALLCERARPVGELVDALNLSQPTVSKHLRVLRQAGLVYVTGDAQRRIYSIAPAPFLSLDAWLQPYRQFWNGRLDLLGHHLDRSAFAPPPTPTANTTAEPTRPTTAEPDTTTEA